MGACDTGRCCKGSLCLNEKKCCCGAKKGVFVLGEVCRTASCNHGGGCDERSVCECDDIGGTLVQDCDPCANVTCDPKQCKQCVNGQCVSICAVCQTCDSSGTVGVCVPKVCPACQSCVSGLCVPYGDPCGFPAACCGPNECCVNGVCVPRACTPACNECQNCVCGDCVLKPTSQCAKAGDCAAGEKCEECQCVPTPCSDYKLYTTYYECTQFIDSFTRVAPETGRCTGQFGGYWYDNTYSPSPWNGCPAGCVLVAPTPYTGPGGIWPPPWGTQVLLGVCQPNPLP